jgi:hypothetical protein
MMISVPYQAKRAPKMKPMKFGESLFLFGIPAASSILPSCL